MNPNFRNVALIAASLGLLVSLYIALSPDDDEAASTTTAVTTTAPGTTAPAETTTAPSDTTPATTAPAGPVRFTVEAGGDVERGSVKLGRDVVIVVRADATDHAHLHGYDLMADVASGKPARIELTASIPGQFELELEERHQLIGVLEVRP
jgi:hypothetical protein